MAKSIPNLARHLPKEVLDRVIGRRCTDIIMSQDFSDFVIYVGGMSPLSMPMMATAIHEWMDEVDPSKRLKAAQSAKALLEMVNAYVDACRELNHKPAIKFRPEPDSGEVGPRFIPN